MNLTTPAQIYHALRRQIHRPFRKPLVVMSPKLLLRHPKAISSLEELASGTFREVIDDASASAAKAEQVILCSGKVYYELLEEHAKQTDPSKYALVRVEQLYPFPAKQLASILAKYKKAKSVVWTQEEPKNNGAWSYIFFKLQDLVQDNKVVSTYYAGRDDRSSPAVGSTYKHKVEQQKLLEDAFQLKA
jgi:2-oxoglutarate dehydrogenase E1 component